MQNTRNMESGREHEEAVSYIYSEGRGRQLDACVAHKGGVGNHAVGKVDSDGE